MVKSQSKIGYLRILLFIILPIMIFILGLFWRIFATPLGGQYLLWGGTIILFGAVVWRIIFADPLGGAGIFGKNPTLLSAGRHGGLRGEAERERPDFRGEAERERLARRSRAGMAGLPRRSRAAGTAGLPRRSRAGTASAAKQSAAFYGDLISHWHNDFTLIHMSQNGW